MHFARTSFPIQAFIHLMILALFAQCAEYERIEPQVHLTFDDIYTEEWLAADSLFARYGARATFFLTHLNQLDSVDYARMLTLQARGHEVGCHGLTHEDPIAYMDAHGIESYLQIEVDSALRLLRGRGFDIHSFAFPYGRYTEALADSLCSRGLRLRGGIYNQTTWLHRRMRSLDQLPVYIASHSQCLADGMGIDHTYGNTMKLIRPGIDHSVQKGKALVLYAHRINESGEDYSIRPATLDSILSYGQSAGVLFTAFRNSSGPVSKQGQN